ncbi:porin [Psychrobacter sp. AOP22-C1-22]|uniref:porin n=1 Tax=unclassified Psychrobacter TaxID=196806 RepID=UPI0017888DAB|nr:porin [Psychrobacter sp. FME6]MBE0405784.1 porin [Psychrobacter sp. FME6]
MKKLLLATAVAALSVSAANAAPQIYGKAFVTADYVNADDVIGDDDSNSLQINSNASRLGFKGSEAMTANTDVVYQLEYGVDIDGEGSQTFKSRDTFLGLANKTTGEFRFGRNTSVLDYVNNVTVTEGFWDNLGSNTLADGGVVEALNMQSDERQDNSIVWIAPKYAGLPLELALQYSADESFVEDNDDRNNGYGASLMFDQGTGYTAGVAYTKDMDAGAGDVIRGTATVDLGKFIAAPVMLGALYQQTDYDFDGSDKEKGLVVSAEMGLANFARPASVYLQYNKTDNLAGLEDYDSDQIVLGGKYMYKDNMIAHAYIGQNSADWEDNDADVFAVGGGLEYLF